jgi:hypothetical protein
LSAVADMSPTSYQLLHPAIGIAKVRKNFTLARFNSIIFIWPVF